MASFKVVIRTLMVVIVALFCGLTFHYYVKDGVARAQAEIPTLPNFEHTNNQQFINNVIQCVEYIEHTTTDIYPVNLELLLAQAALESGWGNSRFKSSTNQAPRQANKGHSGSELILWLRLKLLADVGLVGLPNVGKSSLLSVMSNAKPKIGDFAFTTLTPNLGMVTYKNGDFILADIPGVIEGANVGKGIGIQFLGHIERCQVLVHVLDASSNNIISDFETSLKELKYYKSDMVEKIKCVVLNKVDSIKSKQLEKIVKTFNKKGIEVLPISTFSRVGIDKLKDNLLELLKKNKLKEAKPKERTEKWSPI